MISSMTVSASCAERSVRSANLASASLIMATRSRSRLEFQEVSEQIFSDDRQNRFRMELDPFDTKRLMAEPHDLTLGGLGGNLTTVGKIASIHDERMIARRFKRIG